MKIFEYQCECGYLFNSPHIEYDDEGDEQYDLCPKCRSDRFDRTLEYNLAENAKEVLLVLEELMGCEGLPSYEKGIINNLLKKITLKDYLTTTNK